MRLSIIVPIYGVEKYLRQCLDSIVAQTFRDFEAILIDDGGKDGCPGICDEYVARDGRFRVVHKANAGYGAAVNSGLDVATGDWIGIVEPDDWLLPEMYERLLSGVSDEVDVVKGNFMYIHPRDIHVRGINLHMPTVPFRIGECPRLLVMHPSIWTCIYRRSFLLGKAIRMREVPGAGWVDNPFFFQTTCLSRALVFMDFVGYCYRAPFEDPIIAKSDWRVPYGRMLEIFDWIRANGIEDAGIWDALHQRLLCYAVAMLQMRQHRAEIRKAVAELLDRIDPARMNASGMLDHLTVAKYRLMRDCPGLFAIVVRTYKMMKKMMLYTQLLLMRPSCRKRGTRTGDKGEDA